MRRKLTLAERQRATRLRNFKDRATPDATEPIPVSMSQVRFGLSLCLQRGLSPKQAAELVKRKLGYDVTERAITEWRRTAMTGDLDAES